MTYKDYTIDNINRQLIAMDALEYKIGIFNRSCNFMEIKNNQNMEKIFKLVQWLKFKNLKGHDIFIAPDNDTKRALILVDDLKSPNIEDMYKRGVNPACVVETSPYNYQAWVSLGNFQMIDSHKKIVSSILAKEFHGDPGCVGANHFGRLSGFTNKKPIHQTAKGSPFVKCMNDSGNHAVKGSAIAEYAKHQAEKMSILKQRIEIKDSITQPAKVIRKRNSHGS
jgi:hypothetical protein